MSASHLYSGNPNNKFAPTQIGPIWNAEKILHSFLPLPPSITETSVPANTSTSQEELDALTSKVSSLVNLSIEVVRFATDIQHRLPLLIARQSQEMSQKVAEQVAEQLAAALPPPGSPLYTYTEGIALTPAQLEATFANANEDQNWHVVTVGGDPGLYSSITESDNRVLGYPNGDRRRKSSRTEALAYYRRQYEANKVVKWHRHLTPFPAAPTDDSTS
ncbi:hypothetical protein C8J57DRAFT_1249407 [Mycena rebaudengoi]|nr:hypothetical protein C8J57DRAFT_1249407 [Mycena rebaudengoi]